MQLIQVFRVLVAGFAAFGLSRFYHGESLLSNVTIFFIVALSYTYVQLKKKFKLHIFFLLLISVMAQNIFCVFNIVSLSLFFTFPLLYFYNSGPLKLRKIPYFKPFLISMAWSYTCYLLPLNSLDEFSWITLWESFLFIFILTIPFDITDSRKDKSTGLKSLANSLTQKQIWCVYILLQFTYYFLYSGNSITYYVSYLALTTIVMGRSFRIKNSYEVLSLEILIGLRFLF